jgi:hypothetical protein
MTRNKRSGSLTPFHIYRESEDDRGIVQIAYSEIAVMTREPSGKDCVPATSCLSSHSVRFSMAAAWADGAGSSRGALRGSTSFAGCACVMKNGPTSTRRFWPWLALSFAGTLSEGTTWERPSDRVPAAADRTAKSRRCRTSRNQRAKRNTSTQTGSGEPVSPFA